MSDSFYNSDSDSSDRRTSAQGLSSPADSSRPLVTARGTYDGLILRLDGRADWETLKPALVAYIDSRRDFFAGNPASVEWFDDVPSDVVSRELTELLKKQFSMDIIASSLVSEKKPMFRQFKGKDESQARASSIGDRIAGKFSPRKVDKSLGREVSHMSLDSSDDGFGSDTLKSAVRSPSLFDGVDSIATSNNQQNTQSGQNSSGSRSFVGLSGVDAGESGFSSDFSSPDSFALRSAGRVQQVATPSAAVPVTAKAFDSGMWDDPDTRLVFATLRSGERIETEHSLVVFGDVNPGAEIVAGGDIVVLGILRGTAHAGAYEESGGGRVIFALNLQPTQLRIGSLISRGGTEGGGHSPEVAKIENAAIVVHPYSSRQMRMRRR